MNKQTITLHKLSVTKAKIFPSFLTKCKKMGKKMAKFSI